MSTAPKHHSQAFLDLVKDAKTRVKEIDINEYQRMKQAGEPHMLVDVREDSEWAAGHAAGSMHLGKGIIERDVETKIPDTSAEIILYCGGGFRSALAADNLQKMGYTNVVSMDGGIRAWREAGYPLEKA